MQQQMGIAYTLGKKDAIADANKLTKPMTADEMAKFFDMDKENIACQLPEALTQCECFFSDKYDKEFFNIQIDSLYNVLYNFN